MAVAGEVVSVSVLNALRVLVVMVFVLEWREPELGN